MLEKKVITSMSKIEGWVEKGAEGNPGCQHEWEYDNIVIDTNPPIRHRICKICGRIEHVFIGELEKVTTR